MLTSRKTTNISHFNLKAHPEELTNSFKSALKEDIRISFSFANFSWFDGCENSVRRHLRMKDVYVNKARKIIRTFTEAFGKDDVTTVGVHIRRGDRATQKLYKLGYRVPQMGYFNKAMSYFRKKYKNVLFIIATDDRDWVMQNFPHKNFSDVYLAPKNTFEIDFALLIECDYVIQSVGTFSRWAAFLNGNESIHYKYELLCASSRCHTIGIHNSTRSPFQDHWMTMVN